MGNNGGAFGAFLQSVTTTNFVISAPTTITNVTLSSASLSESQNYVQTGPVAYFGSGEWDIGVLEPEQSILPSPAVTIASAAKVSIGKVHTENLCFTNTGSCYLIDNYSDSLHIGTWEELNQSVLTGQNIYLVRDNSTGSSANQAIQPAQAWVGNLWARDVANFTGTFNFGTTSGVGLPPVLAGYSTSQTIRARSEEHTSELQSH